MTRAHLNLLIAGILVIGTLGYFACAIYARSAAVTYGVGYIIVLLSAPLATRWRQRR